MPADKVMDLVLGLGMEVLELVGRTEFNDIETIGKDTVC